MFRVNTYGAFFCTQQAVKQMKAEGKGVILNVTSYAQAGGEDHLSAYNASKGAIASFTYSWALELAQQGIRVNAISPSGATRMTEFLNSRRQPSKLTDYPSAELIAPLAVFLVSDYASNITGQVIGTTDKDAAEPKDRPVHFGEVLATLYHQMGLDVNSTRMFDLRNRPQYLVDEGITPMPELI